MTVTAARPASRTAGFDSLDREIRIDSLPVQGEIPHWLTGSLVRPGPAQWEVGGQQMRHWFDGLCMLHRFSFGDGGVSYASRFLAGRSYRAAKQEGRIVFGEFATDPCRTLFSRVHSMFSPELGDNANVNMVKLGDRCMAMTETPISVQFDQRTLDAAGVAYTAPGQLSTAHPHLDRSSGAMLNYAASLGARTEYRFYSQAPGDSPPQILATRSVREPAYMHSFGLTERWLVLAEFPFLVNPLRLALGGRPYIENYRWKPERGTRFTLLDRRTGESAGPFRADPCFAFHHVNAFEDGDDVVADVCVYPDNGIVDDLYLDRLRDGKPITPAHLRRFRISPGSETVAEHDLVDEPFELPRINYGRCNERPYRYAWGVSSGDSGWFERIAKVDVPGGTAQTWQEDGRYPGEPVFVPVPGEDVAEDAGVLLSVVLDGTTATSFLLVLDARTLAELGRAEVPHHIPYGFHGQYLS